MGTSHSIMTMEVTWVGRAAVWGEAKGVLGVPCFLLSCSWWWPSWPQGKLSTGSPPTKRGMERSRRGIHFLQLLQVPSGTQGTHLVVTPREDITAASGCTLPQDHSQHNVGQDTVLWAVTAGRGRSSCSHYAAQGLCSSLLCKAHQHKQPMCVLVGLSAQGSWANCPLYPIPAITSRSPTPRFDDCCNPALISIFHASSRTRACKDLLLSVPQSQAFPAGFFLQETNPGAGCDLTGFRIHSVLSGVKWAGINDATEKNAHPKGVAAAHAFSAVCTQG